MDIVEAIKLLNSRGLIVETLESIPIFNLSRFLSKLLKNSKDIFCNDTAAGRNANLMALNPKVLKENGITIEELESKINPLGWSIGGNTSKQIVLIPLHRGVRNLATGETIEPRGQRYDAIEALKRAEGVYVRFSDIPPNVIKRIGFRTTKDRNYDFKSAKIGNEQYWNQGRIYVFSVEEAFKCTRNLVEVSRALKFIVNSGYEYGRYMYIIQDRNNRFNSDPEYTGDFSNIPGYLEYKVNPEEIIGFSDTKDKNDAVEVIWDLLKLNDIKILNRKGKKINLKDISNNTKRRFTEYNPLDKTHRDFDIEKWE